MEKDAEQYKDQMSRPHLIFQTADNADRVAAYYVQNGLIDPAFIKACEEEQNATSKLEPTK